MFALFTFNLLLLWSPVHSFRFNGFRYLTKEMASSVAFEALTSKHETLWLEQRLDHFDENENRTWKMRYFRRRDIWKPRGPIYIFLGGESEATPSFLYTGVMYELAKETNGALYMTEHRYYGKSVPVSGTGAKDMKYLSAKQALADNAKLIRTIKLNPLFSSSKVVVVGGSYSGNLAAWMRLLYPDLVDAAIASSAPVLAKKDFYEYLEKVSDDYEQYGTEGCWDAINKFFRRYEVLFESKEGIEELKQDENICPDNDINIPENKQLFFATKISKFMFNAQYGDTKQIKDHCLNFNKTDEISLFDDFGFWTGRKQCYEYNFNKMIEDTYKNKINWVVSWTYQTCTEYGYFQSTSSNRHPFTNNVPVDLYTKICTSAFGPEFNNTSIDRGIDDVNSMYGGLDPNVVNVVFVNGNLDPWSRLSVLEDLSYNAPAIIIPRSSHCRDLFSNRDGDPEELKEARKNTKYWIKKWIGAEDFIDKKETLSEQYI